MVRLTIKSRKVPIEMFTAPVGAISGIYPRRDLPSTTRRSIRPTPPTRNTMAARRSIRPTHGARNTMAAPIASPDNSGSDSDSDSDSASSGDTVITPALPENTDSGSGSKAQSQTLIRPIILSDDSNSDSQPQSESESESLSSDRKEPTPSAQFRASTSNAPPATETAHAPPLENSTEQREAGDVHQSVGEKRKRISEENSELPERNDIQIRLARMEKRQIQMSSDIAQMKDTLESIISLLLDQPPSCL